MTLEIFIAQGSEFVTESTHFFFSCALLRRSMINNHTFFKNESMSEYSSHTKIFVIINCVLNAVLMSIVIIGNSLVILAILKTPVLRSPSITLLCRLAVTDLLDGLVVQPLYIAKELIDDVFPFSNLLFYEKSSPA